MILFCFWFSSARVLNDKYFWRLSSTPTLTRQFTTSHSSRVFSVAIYIHKKRDKCQARSYRPVSLTSIMQTNRIPIETGHNKIHEGDNQFFSEKQYDLSVVAHQHCSYIFLEILDKWTEAIDNVYEIDCIYMDCPKPLTRSLIEDSCVK